MRILLIHNRERKTGGESVSFEREAEALEGLGHSLLVLQKSNRDFELSSVWRKAWLAFLSVFNLPAYFALRRAIRHFSPDVALVHNPFPLWSVACYIALLSERVPIVHVVHNYRLRCLNGLYFRNATPCTLCRTGHWWHGVRYRCANGSRAQSLAYALITQTVWPLGIVKRVGAFRVLSDFSRAQLIEMGVPKDRIHTIPNRSPQLGFVRRPTNEPTWVFLGHLGAAKGPQVAVGAMARGAPGKLVIIGGGPLLAQLQQRVADEKLPVEFLGFREGPERFHVLRQAWALVFPSLCFENGPLAVLEALSLGVPVVGSRIGSVPEYLSDGVSGRLFTPGDEAELAEILRALGSDPAERDRLSAGARRAAEQQFSEGTLGKDLVGLLQQTIAQARSRTPL